MSIVKLGALVKSSSAFDGIGKIVDIDVKEQSATIGFFHSPLEPYANQIEVYSEDLMAVTKMQEQTLIFCKVGHKQRWKSGFYGGERPHGRHLVIFNRDEMSEYETEDLFIPNSYGTTEFNPKDYLVAKGNTSPFLTSARADFSVSYHAQKASTRLIPSLLSSSVELEPHQLAVVKRVLQDKQKKYLLCDEVGLGKTIEAGFLIREHILERRKDSCVFIFTPDSLTKQWHQELTERFHLEDILEGCTDQEDQLIHIGGFKDALKLSLEFGQPSMIVIDEAHQLSPFAWSEKQSEKFVYNEIATKCHNAEVALLLSGTPLLGNERDYLAMLHCIDAESHQLTDTGLDEFSNKLKQQSRFLGYYRPLDPGNDNETIETVLDDIEALQLGDEKLNALIEDTKPLVDFWAEDGVDPEERKSAVLKLREYFGNKYTIEYRMLRNRRSVNPDKRSHIDMLFPGLGNCEIANWVLLGTDIFLDEQFDSYRSTAFNRPDTYRGLSKENFTQWLEALLTSPLALKEHIEKALVSEISLPEDEKQVLNEMLDSVEEEQLRKDGSLAGELFNWLDLNSDGKAVVFCGHEKTADNVYQMLLDKFGDLVERHVAGNTPKFIAEPDIRVLVCDHAGEDGLNLQGTKRLAVHYSLPLSISRIEQRNGRLNRYSAYSKSSEKVQSLILVPERDGFYKQWAQLLISGVKVFSRNCASLQYKIDEFIDSSWPDIHTKGYSGLLTLSEQLAGVNGVVDKAIRDLEVQEVFEQDVLDIVNAKKFSNQVYQDDIAFEESTAQMKKWITEGLLFDMKNNLDGSFRCQFQFGRTRLNISDFIDYCLLGMDLDYGAGNPVTKPMSYSRTLCAQTGVYPFRYGQPFVDAIERFTSSTPLGLSAAFIRTVQVKLEKPHLCYQVQWLVRVNEENCSKSDQIYNYEECPPIVYQAWYQDNGDRITDENIISLLSEQYSQKGRKSEKLGVPYQDRNLSVSVIDGRFVDFWDFVEEEFNDEYWKSSIETAYAKSKNDALSKLVEGKTNLEREAKLLSMSAVVLMGGV